jgi:drug/metabolite transporter (DMT)-like permease
MGGIAGIVADNLTISNHDLIIALLMGFVQFGIGFLCFTIATRYILASEVALFALTESILGPIWVWIGVGEQPSLLTLLGSGIVLVCVVSYCIVGIRDERRRLAVRDLNQA